MKTKSEIVGYLKGNVGLFAGFPNERLGGLVDGSRITSFEANEAIVYYGSEAVHLGVVLSGAATASVLGSGGTPQTVGRIEAGGTVGEMALMSGDKMLADIVAESRCEVLLIPVSLFQSVIVAEPGAVQYISRTIADRFKALLADPSAATAALVQSPDPYGLQLKGERPEKILVINCGSSSLKYRFYDTADERCQARGLVERVGIAGTRHVYQRNYTPYEGDGAFLAPATERTKNLWKRLEALVVEERNQGRARRLPHPELDHGASAPGSNNEPQHTARYRGWSADTTTQPESSVGVR